MNSCAIFISVFLLALLVPHCSANRHISKMLIRSRPTPADPKMCFQKAVCQPVQNATCFGTALPYSHTAFSLAEDSLSFLDVQDNLAMWKGLRSVPRCWAVIQPFLCAVYMPKCENGSIFLPSREMCLITRDPCKVIDVKHSWPSFLQCENENLYPSGCRNPLQEIKFNVTSKCMKPLIETEVVENWYDEVEGCGIQCQNPFFSEQEHEDTHRNIFVATLISFFLSLFAVLTLGICWKSIVYYPNRIVFWLNFCILLASSGWLIQFIPGAREEIVCLPDGSIRHGQVRSNYYVCFITFVLVYYFLIAAMIWFVILTYALKIACCEARASKEVLKKKASCFHLLAWCIPVLLSLIIWAMNEVDGDSMSGICFVGYANMMMRAVFLLLPLSVAIIVSAVNLFIVLYNLIKVKLHNEENNPKVKRNKHRIIINTSICVISILLILFCTLGCHLHTYLNEDKWKESLREYIICSAMNSEIPMTKCILKSKPSNTTLLLNIACFLGFAFISFFWVLTNTLMKGWKLLFFRCCASAERNANHIKKHELIDKNLKDHPQINQGHISLSLDSNFKDPIGLNLDVVSVASNVPSKTACSVMQCNVAPINSPYSLRQYSSASDISHQTSVDSFNQPNFDSRSLQISEQEYHALRHPRRRTRRERFQRFLKATLYAPSNRRGSDTSLQSSLMTTSFFPMGKNIVVKNTKSTSTGDLCAQSASILANGGTALPPMFQPPINRPNITREVVNPPFTHGMTDNSHRLNCPSMAPSVTANQRFSPNLIQPAFQNAFGGMVLPAMYGQGFDMLSYGYMGGAMFPSMNFPGYPSSADFNFSSYVMPFGADPVMNPYPNLIPLHPRAETPSETGFLPILSDSEFTDAGHRSYDEAQLMAAQHLLNQCANNPQVLAKNHPPNPGLQPQECAKTKFLERTKSQNSKPVTELPRPPSGIKSSHSEVPPPSPADSNGSLDMGDDEVFEDGTDAEPHKRASMISLPPASEGMLEKFKAKFKRSISLTKNYPPPGEELVTAKAYSLKNLTEMRLSPISKTAKKETCLHASEKVSLMACKEGSENVSR